MDAITLLKDDHRTVEQLFKRFEQAGERAHVQKRQIVDRIIEELSVHAAIEEQAFYPVARAAVPDTEDMALESLEEHHVVKWLLSELVDMDPAHERFDAKVTVLIENVRHHVEEEESDFFPKVRKQLGRNQLADLGETLADAKTSAPTRPHPRMPDTFPANLIAGTITGVVDRVRDNLSGIAQGGVTAVQDLVARDHRLGPTKGLSDRLLDHPQPGERSPLGRLDGGRHRAGDGSQRQHPAQVDREGGQGRRQGHGHVGEEVRPRHGDDGQACRHDDRPHRTLRDEEHGGNGQGRRQGHGHLGEEVHPRDGDDGQACRHDDRPHRTLGDEEDGGHGQARCGVGNSSGTAPADRRAGHGASSGERRRPGNSMFPGLAARSALLRSGRGDRSHPSARRAQAAGARGRPGTPRANAAMPLGR